MVYIGFNQTLSIYLQGTEAMWHYSKKAYINMGTKINFLFSFPCDKGGGIIICDFDRYKESCLNHLASKTVTGLSIYRESSEKELARMTKTIG